jgi:hypothetical protein
MLVVVKDGNGAGQEYTREGAVCFDPPVELVPHPKREDTSCILSTQFGTKVVEMPYKSILEKLKAHVF